MAKVVIAGKADCPYLAKIELIGDKLSKNLPDFNLHKIIKSEDEWEPWLDQTCHERGWSHKRSPLVWRELIDRGGKGVLIGGANEFQEYVMGYYGIQSDLTSADMLQVAEENKLTKIELDEELRVFQLLTKPLPICITNASSNICYNLLAMIASGDVFGQGTEVSIRLYDSEGQRDYLIGLQMEANDLSFGLLRDVQVVCDAREAFTDCSVIVLLDELLKEDGEIQQSWLKRNAEYFKNYATIINKVAAKNVQILIAGPGPVNLNTYVFIKNAPSIRRHNVVAMSRMVENHAKSVVGGHLSVNPAGVVDLVVWGNLYSKTYVDVSKARVHGYDGAIWGPPFFSVSAQEMIHDNKWIDTEFPELLSKRRAAVETALGHPASMAMANAVATTLNHWSHGSPKGQIFSLGVCSEGSYDVPEGLVFSFPVTMHPQGYYNIVQDIALSDSTRLIIADIVKELTAEIDMLSAPTPPPTPEQPEDNNMDTQTESTLQGGEQNSQQGGEQKSQEDQKPETIPEEKEPEGDEETTKQEGKSEQEESEKEEKTDIGEVEEENGELKEDIAKMKEESGEVNEEET